ncbi:MAG: hypothetical protein M5U34_39625 [Chloroflexi bacterium]|nr:hypothetical protein [Chloroflexota bacterium]
MERASKRSNANPKRCGRPVPVLPVTARWIRAGRLGAEAEAEAIH